MKWKCEPYYTIRNPDGDVVFTSYLLFCLLGHKLELHVFPPFAEDGVGCYHTHPYRAWRCLLQGMYTEEFPPKTVLTYNADPLLPRTKLAKPEYELRRPGHMDFVEPGLSHRIKAVGPQGALSLWFHGRRTDNIYLEGDGWPKGIQRILG